MKRFYSLFILLPFLWSLTMNALAHNVVGGVYVNGFDIEGEAGFSNGAMANAGTLVKVSDQSGTPLGEVVTDEDGFFIFTARKRINHVFEINMGAGHTLKMLLPAEELPEDLDNIVNNNINSGNSANSSNIDTSSAATSASKTSVNTKTSTITSQNMNNVPMLSAQITPLMLDKAIAKQIKPLRKEIQALKEKSGFRDMIGGIGYIFGLLGLVAFLRERKLKANK
ncbi:hypothetical protein [Psychromonas arctica]|uniref:hypothetical protein n=1 Tax=Psychromonas arctica TaxID=168275 RepID=UPI0004161EFA|nr:hypothetical protein [Psychromonas arctica]